MKLEITLPDIEEDLVNLLKWFREYWANRKEVAKVFVIEGTQNKSKAEVMAMMQAVFSGDARYHEISTATIPNQTDKEFHDEQLDVGRAMIKYGGGFVNWLGETLLRADRNNAEIIKNSFPKYWEEYKIKAQR